MKIICDKCKTPFEAKRKRKNCSKECGRKHAIFKYETARPEQVLLNRAKQRAKKNNLEFSLKLEDIIIPEFCPVLGIPLILKFKTKDGVYKNAPSLDRIDVKKGYTKENSRIISNRANNLKSNATIEELEKILKDSYEINRRL